ncbi:helix-turn-helix transcriptional regulator [Bacillus sp. A116_S68]|jgi:transcriptional regulator with XRE-family HTH domain|nr:helix-turn-helix transcriptional regulator [Bacillus sp. A116_S68]
MSNSNGHRIKYLRKKQGISLRELADRVNINYSVISRIESGSRQLSDSEIKSFADYFDVSADYLLGRTDKPEQFDSDYDPLEDLKQFMIENDMQNMDFGFYDIEKWKKLSKEDIQEVKRHFEWVVARAEQENEGDN